VVWSFTAVDTTAGQNCALPGLFEKDWPLEDTTLAYAMELPRDWPLGNMASSSRSPPPPWGRWISRSRSESGAFD
jgi:hypothetical protein